MTLAVLMTASCATGDTAAEDTYSAPVPDALERYYEQSAQWEPCDGDFECATVDVPLDYGNPDGASIGIAMIRQKAIMPRGSLLVNPGGPGASGVGLVKNAGSATFSPTLREKFHLVGFDPRGVGDSAPVECRSDDQLDASRVGEAMDIDDLGALCARDNARVLPHVDTDSAARDLDILRSAVGDERLNYLGFSYGTKLGAAYSDLFGGNVGRMVLDGAMNPVLGIDQVTTGQAQRFEQSLREWVSWCDGVRGCPVDGGVEEGLAELEDLFDRLADAPLTTADGREFNDQELVNALLLAMYDDGWWDSLVAGMMDLEEGDPAALMSMADARSGRLPDGTYADNSWDAFTAVNCLDYPEPAVSGAALDRKLEDISPTLGWYLGGDLSCAGWPAESTGDLEPAQPLEESAEALVIGTTGDPATPYEWSQALADQLAGEDPSNVHLLTYEGLGHTAYGRSNDCVTRAVDEFLIDGEAPEPGKTC
ncbi:alpha/beta hydrolase [Zhihengliuella salsuginis]|uniref:Alpha/beta hydrolase n=1 Tax=Zhihengliuella salsuginis TaxID=578222 RepID=A0ABQ3GNS7_9MICC|nr:alpha/beta hydrolase [Zhihengliuella salsuginis]